MDDERLNLPRSCNITIEAFGHRLHLLQDPNSQHLGMTVWDASMVFIKFLEKNSRKGRFCPSKLKGKRVVELGAGCGLSGIGMALLGCNVISTDQSEVLPLLRRNIDRNVSYIMQGNVNTESFGSIEVAELDWGNNDHIQALGPPFDYIIGTDIVYAEHLIEPLLQTIIALSRPRTTILLCYEIRSTTLHEAMFQMLKSNFEVRSVSKNKMDNKYQHPCIQLYLMEPNAQQKFHAGTSQTVEPDCKSIIAEDETSAGGDEIEVESREEESWKETMVSEQVMELGNKGSDDWEIRRCGAMAARLLRDVKIS